MGDWGSELESRRLRAGAGFQARLHSSLRACLTRPGPQVWCRCVTSVFNYFVVTNFFWMFVEGCYLHVAIARAYSTERLRTGLFLFIGWCESSGSKLPPSLLEPTARPGNASGIFQHMILA